MDAFLVGRTGESGRCDYLVTTTTTATTSCFSSYSIMRGMKGVAACPPIINRIGQAVVDACVVSSKVGRQGKGGRRGQGPI